MGAGKQTTRKLSIALGLGEDFNELNASNSEIVRYVFEVRVKHKCSKFTK